MYDLIWDAAAKRELARLSVFLRRIILNAVETQLRHQPDLETRNRKAIREPLHELPDASWELRVRGYRVLYWMPGGGTVAVLRVILKGTASLEDAIREDGQP